MAVVMPQTMLVMPQTHLHVFIIMRAHVEKNLVISVKLTLEGYKDW